MRLFNIDRWENYFHIYVFRAKSFGFLCKFTAVFENKITWLFSLFYFLPYSFEGHFSFNYISYFWWCMCWPIYICTEAAEKCPTKRLQTLPRLLLYFVSSVGPFSFDLLQLVVSCLFPHKCWQQVIRAGLLTSEGSGG
jgi:hypothetical protein